MVKTVLARSAPIGGLDRVRARRLQQVLVAARERHPAVRALVAEQHLAAGLRIVVAPLQPRQQHAVLEPARLARVATLAERRRSHVVLVLAVLAVHELRRHDHRAAPASSIVNSSSIIARWR